MALAIRYVNRRHAVGVRELQKIDRPGNETCPYFVSPFCPLRADFIQGHRGRHQSRIKRRIVQHSFIQIQNYSRRQIGKIASLLERRRPMRIAKALQKGRLRHPVGLHRGRLIFHSCLHPQHRVQVLVCRRRSGLRQAKRKDRTQKHVSNSYPQHGFSYRRRSLPNLRLLRALVFTQTVSKARASTTSPLLSTFSQTEENACAYVSIKSRETPSNTAITLFVGPYPFPYL